MSSASPQCSFNHVLLRTWHQASVFGRRVHEPLLNNMTSGIFSPTTLKLFISFLLCKILTPQTEMQAERRLCHCSMALQHVFSASFVLRFKSFILETSRGFILYVRESNKFKGPGKGVRVRVNPFWIFAIHRNHAVLISFVLYIKLDIPMSQNP